MFGNPQKPHPSIRIYALYSSARSARLEAMREAECNRRARHINIIIDLILLYIYISASFNHTMHLLHEALIYTECIPSYMHVHDIYYTCSTIQLVQD